MTQLARRSYHLAIFIRESAGRRVNRPHHESRPPYWHAVARVEAGTEGLPGQLRPCRCRGGHPAPPVAAAWSAPLQPCGAPRRMPPADGTCAGTARYPHTRQQERRCRDGHRRAV